MRGLDHVIELTFFSRPPTMPVGVIIPFRSSMPPSIMPRPPHRQLEEFIITRWATNHIILIFYNKRKKSIFFLNNAHASM